MKIPASRRVFFLGVMGWEDDSQVCRRRYRRTPLRIGQARGYCYGLKLKALRPRFRTIHSFPDGAGSPMLDLGLRSYFLDIPVDD